MRPVFISYRRVDGSDDVDALARALRIRGLMVWRDIDDLTRGQPVEEEVRRAIEQECYGVVCYITKRFLDSGFIWRVEVPASLARKRNEPEFPIIPLFAAIAPSEVRKLGPDAQSLVALSGEPVLDPASASVHVLRSALRNWRSEFVAPQRPLPMTFVTRLAIPAIPNGGIYLDWRKYFPGGRPADPAAWGTDLMPGLRDLRSSITESIGPRRISCRGNAHLSAALVLGHTFSKRTGFEFSIEQSLSNDQVATWDSDGNVTASDLSPLQDPPDTAAEDALLMVSVSRETRPDTEVWLRSASLRFRYRTELRPAYGVPNRDFVRGAEHARGIVRDVTQCIISLQAKVRQLHLVISAPWSVAIMLGQQLDACGPLHVYEHDRAIRSYVRACTLD